MRTYAFSVILNASEATEQMANALFEAGCDDCVPGECHGVVIVHFDRESDSMESAVTSAVRQIITAGYQVKRVEMDAEEVASLLSR